jgi:hypothetical protein
MGVYSVFSSLCSWYHRNSVFPGPEFDCLWPSYTLDTFWTHLPSPLPCSRHLEMWVVRARRNLENFPFLVHRKVWGVLVLVLLQRSGRIQQWIYQILNFCFLGDFIAASISLLVIDLFRWFMSSWFNFRWLYVSRNFFISSRFSNLFEYRFSK